MWSTELLWLNATFSISFMSHQASIRPSPTRNQLVCCQLTTSARRSLSRSERRSVSDHLLAHHGRRRCRWRHPRSGRRRSRRRLSGHRHRRFVEAPVTAPSRRRGRRTQRVVMRVSGRRRSRCRRYRGRESGARMVMKGIRWRRQRQRWGRGRGRRGRGIAAPVKVNGAANRRRRG